MSTNDVPGANPANRDVLAMGVWAEHDDGSLIFVESVEGGRVVYSIFDLDQDPPVEYRDAMPETGFKSRFSWRTPSTQKDADKKAKTFKGKKKADDLDDDDLDDGVPNIRWVWHDKTPFPWDRVMQDFPAGSRRASADAELNAAQRVARSLNLRAEEVREHEYATGRIQRAARQIAEGIVEAISSLKP